MDDILRELEKRVERVASAIKKLKEENVSLGSANRELRKEISELEKAGSGSDGVVRELKSRIVQLENERNSLVELRKRVETRLETILSQFDWLEQ